MELIWSCSNYKLLLSDTYDTPFHDGIFDAAFRFNAYLFHVFQHLQIYFY